MTASYLRACGASWLRYDLQCPIVTFERGLAEYHGYNAAPDLFAMTKARQTIEVEIKTSFADFKANFEKRIIFMQKRGFVQKPFQFFFLVPPGLVEKVKASALITWEGILTPDGRKNPYTGLPGITVALPCKPNKKARKLDTKQLVTLVRNQSGSLVTALVNEAKNLLMETQTLSTPNM